MKRFNKNILVTGGAGFIGSHIVRRLVLNYENYQVFNLDSLTYSGNLENLIDIENCENYKFLLGDIRDKKYLKKIFNLYKFDSVINLAAESHVDRSINNPLQFAETNIIGTLLLLNEFKNLHQSDFKNKLFYQISTDEVYGTLGEEGLFTESSPYKPNSPYSASKAGSDHFVRAYGETYGLPYKISNCSNNYGPNQFPEKLIPLSINNIINNKPLPVYGDGNYTRDWLFVIDHAEVIDLIFHKGKLYETYNIGGLNEWKNIDLVQELCKMMDEKLNRPFKMSEKLIKFVEDRPGHDLRYAIDASKIKSELGWTPSVSFKEGLSITIDWYINNERWLKNCTSGEYKQYYKKQYK
tara:strand:- start:109 stop:1167 length:1059 start_codon:yes stop_codon:yes gene_type:complete